MVILSNVLDGRWYLAWNPEDLETISCVRTVIKNVTHCYWIFFQKPWFITCYNVCKEREKCWSIWFIAKKLSLKNNLVINACVKPTFMCFVRVSKAEWHAQHKSLYRNQKLYFLNIINKRIFNDYMK